MRLSRPAALAACLLLASPAAFAVTSLKLLRTADGSVRTLNTSISTDILGRMTARNDGKVIPGDQ